MKCIRAILAASLMLSLGGCVFRKQPAAKTVPPPPAVVAPAPPPPQPPPKLSTPQTTVELPPPQPVNPEALAQMPAPVGPPAPASVRTPRRAPAAQPRTEPTTVGPAPPTPPTQPPETEHPTLQEIVPAGDMKRFQEETAARRKEISMRLEQARDRKLRGYEKQLLDRIQDFLKQCDAAQARGDWRMASALSERALALSRELTGAK